MRLGAMIDCSRGGVYTVSALKKYINALKKMGYNYLQLYTEDTYEIAEDPHFGYLRGRYSVEEIKEIDAYALQNGVELIPCIQTLAHLMGLTRWWKYGDVCDTGNILLCGEESTYSLIDKMFLSCAACFTSRRIHIGMDEAHMVGLGKYLDKHGYRNRFDIILKHLNRVCEIADKYGFKPMMWSDMFFHLAKNMSSNGALPENILSAVPRNLELVCWDYYNLDKEFYDNQFEAHAKFNNKTVFACGAWSWSGFVPHNKWSIKVNETAFRSAIEHGIDDILVTCWRDDGSECSLFGNLPALYVSAEYARGNFDLESINDGFKNIFGIEFERFCALDEPDMLDGVGMNNPAKYSLYSDPFLGFTDYLVDEGKKERFKAAKKKIDESSDNAEYGYIFKTISSLCSVLEIKYGLGVRTRKAYSSGDKKQLKRLVKDYGELDKRVKALYVAFREQWDRECKLNGFEHHDIRFGGLMLRLKHCKKILEDFIAGRTSSIPALEEEILPLWENNEKGKSINYNRWHSTAIIKNTEN